VNGVIWQQGTGALWWGETQPNDAWAPAAGTSVSPVPTQITIPANQATATVRQSQVSVVATSGNHMVFIHASGDRVMLSGGNDKVTDTGSGNTYVIPAAGKGYDTFTSDILKNDTLDFTSALQATSWNGTAGALTGYLHLSTASGNAVISISSSVGGTATAVATIRGGGSETFTSLLAHSIT